MSRDVLGDVRCWLERFVVTADPGDLDLLTLWIAHTHVVGALGVSPRLLITSPTHGSGKSLTLGLVALLAANAERVGQLPSAPVLRALLDSGATVLLDEAGKALPRAGAKPTEVQSLALSMVDDGYKSGAAAWVNTMQPSGRWVPEKFTIHGPLGLGGNALSLPAESVSRCVTLRLFRDTTGRAEPYDSELHDDEGNALREALAEWAREAREGIRVDVDLPEALAHGRPRELWRALGRVGLAAGHRWPDRAMALARRAAAEAASEEANGPGEERPHETLLRHLQEVWPEGSEFEPTLSLLDRLHHHDRGEWMFGGGHGGALTAARLGRMVSQYGVRSDQPTRGGARGYRRADFAKFWPNENDSQESASDKTAIGVSLSKPMQAMQAMQPMQPNPEDAPPFD